MIISCNSCDKKFVVPDEAITSSGRLVQCSSCGNKWKQFPINKTPETKKIKKKPVPIPVKLNKNTKVPKSRKIKTKRKKGPDLYSPEYLSKKHGIKINSTQEVHNKHLKDNNKINFGFYNSLIVFTILTIFVLKVLHFSQETIIEFFPITEVYIEYLFETLMNLKDIIQNFFSGY